MAIFKSPAEKEAERRNLERLIVLAGFPDHHPLWQTILAIVDEHEENMVTEALAERLNDSDRQYAAGEAAGARKLANALRDLKAQATREVLKRKQQE